MPAHKSAQAQKTWLQNEPHHPSRGQRASHATSLASYLAGQAANNEVVAGPDRRDIELRSAAPKIAGVGPAQFGYGWKEGLRREHQWEKRTGEGRFVGMYQTPMGLPSN